jgi:hypothetical protein
MSTSALLVNGLECANHPDVLASYPCYVCSKPLCGDCCVQVNEVAICDDPSHRTIREEWIRIVQSHSEFECDMIARNLEQQGMMHKCFSSQTYNPALPGDSKEFVNVFVPKDVFERSLRTLTDLDILDICQESQ